MRKVSLFKNMLIASSLLLTSAAQAGTCYQSAPTAGKSIDGLNQNARITIYSHNRADKIDRLSIKDTPFLWRSNRVNAETILGCTGSQPNICSIEDDGGSFTMRGQGKEMYIQMINKNFRIKKNDGGEDVVVVRHHPGSFAYRLVTVNESICKKLFPYDNSIRVDSETDDSSSNSTNSVDSIR